MQDWVYVAISLIAVIGGCIFGINWVRTRHPPATITVTEEGYKNLLTLKDKTIKALQKECDELEYDVSHWRGKFGKSQQVPKINPDMLGSGGEITDSLIEQYLPTLANSLPKEFGGLLLDHKKDIIELVKQHPELIQKFIGKGSPADKPSSVEDVIKNRAV